MDTMDIKTMHKTQTSAQRYNKKIDDIFENAKRLNKYHACNNYVENQTAENWQRVKNEVIASLTFEERLKLSKEQDMY